MRRVLVFVLILLAAGVFIGAQASKHKPAHSTAPSRKVLRQTPRAQRAQISGMQQRMLHGRARTQSRKAATGAANPVRSAVQSVMAENPPTTSIGLLAAAGLVPGIAYPESVAAGDFNGDGIRDLVFTANDSSYDWQLFTALGKGDGSFEAAKSLTTSVPCVGRLFATDLNNDQKDDIVLIGCDSGGITHIYVSDGTGGAGAVGAYTAFPSGGFYWCSIWDGCIAYAITDRDGNGTKDLIQVRGNQISTLLGNGDGSFQDATVETLPGGNPWVVGLGDLNGDGYLDVFGEIDNQDGNGYVLQTIAGTATGFSETTKTYSKPLNAWSSNLYAMGDVNGDGLQDIVSLDQDALGVTVFYQGTDATFTAKGPVFSGDYTYAMSLADVNGDGGTEIVTVQDYTGTAAVLGGDTLAVQATYATGGWPYTPPVVADFNGDGKLDMVIANDTWDLAFLRNLGDGTFAAARFYWPEPVGAWFDEDIEQYVFGVATGDLNNDGFTDVVAGMEGYSQTGIAVFLNNGDGTLKPGFNLGAGGEMYNVALGDLNGDGNLDIVAADQYDYTVNVFMGDGTGKFQAPVYYLSAYDNDDPFGPVVEKFNADGKPDVAADNYYVLGVLLNDGTGRLLDPVDYDLEDSRWDGRLRAADVNGDGKLDLVTQGEYTIEILTGKGDGTFDDAATVGWNSSYYFDTYYSDLVLGDVNRDGKVDLIATTSEGCYYCESARRNTASPEGWEGVLVSLGNGDGTFADPTLHMNTLHDFDEWYSYPSALALADMNGDGNLDVLVGNSEYGSVSLLYGDGTGEFYDPVEYLSVLYPFGMVATDMNGDSAPDVVVGSYSDWEYVGGVAVMENTGGVALTAVSDKNPAAEGDTVSIASTLKASARGITAVPTGAIAIYDGTAKVGESTLTDGAATIALADPLTAGAHEFTVSYGGDANFLPTAGILLQMAHGPNDYDLTVDNSSAEVMVGQAALYMLKVTPKNGFVGTVSFACSNLPSGVSCGFAPATATPNGKDPVEVHLSIHTTGSGSSAALHPQGTSQLPVWATLWGAGVMGVVLVGSRKRKLAFLISLVALAILLVVLVGCGDTKTITKTVEKQVQPTTPTGTYTVTVSASSVGGTAKPLELTLKVK